MRNSTGSGLSGCGSDASPGAARPVAIVATLAEPANAMGVAPAVPLSQVQGIEVRADLIGDVDPRPLRSGFSGSLIYTLRSTAEGGGCADAPDLRRRRLIAAADHYDFVDLEAPRDLHPEVLGRIAPERRVVSWQGPATDLAGLRGRFEALKTVGAHLYRLAPRADTQAEALVPLLLLRSLARGDVTAYARGPAGTWTRALAARYGAPVVFGLLEEAARGSARPPADGDLPLHRLLADYPPETLARAEKLYGIIGASTTMGLSPLIHNTAYRSLGLPALFLPFSTAELTRSLAELGAGLDELGLPLLGLTVVAPHKADALALAAESTPLARRAGTASLLVRRPSGWWADNEAAGVVATLAARQVTVADRPVAVIGCGGGGRAAAAGLAHAGAKVTLVNRGRSRGEEAAKLLDLPFVPLAGFDSRPFSVVIHVTPVTDALPFRIDGLDPTTVIFDLNYRTTDTPLIAAARAAGHVTLDGRDMLLAELSRQFHLMTGRDMPIADVRAALDLPTIEDDTTTADHTHRPSGPADSRPQARTTA